MPSDFVAITAPNPAASYMTLLRRNNAALGLAQSEQGIGFVSFGAALIGAFVIFIFQLLLFYGLRNVKALAPIYKPKGELIKVDLKSLFTMSAIKPKSEIIRDCGMDAYCFLRYLRIQILIFLPICGISLPVLIPLNYIQGNGQSAQSDESNAPSESGHRMAGLDTLAWGNIKPENSKRYTAHLIVAVIIIVWVCAVFFFEFRCYTKIRQDYLKSHAKGSPNTVLVSSIPREFLDTTRLKDLFKDFPGGVENIWLNRNLNELSRAISYRDDTNAALEKALTIRLIKHLRALRKSKCEEPQNGDDGLHDCNIVNRRKVEAPSESLRSGAFVEGPARITTRLLEISLPIDSNEEEGSNDPTTYGPGFWTLRRIRRLLAKRFSYPRSSNIIHYSRELARLNGYIDEEQDGLRKQVDGCLRRYPLLNSAYIQFKEQIAAHMACQAVISHMPRQMIPTLCEVAPGDIIWGNMALSWWQELARTAVVVLVLIVMIVLWAIPVAWSAALGQLSNLIEAQGWLSFLKRSALAEYVAKALAGVLPAVVLEALLFVVPLILKGLARIKGSKTIREETQFIQTVYFIFLFMQVFLVVSIASFFTVTISEYLDNLKKLQTVQAVLNLLAKNLPKAANYFFCYMILQALATSSGTLLQVRRLVSWFFIAPLRDITPRQKWIRRNEAGWVSWGSFFPVYTNFACIGLIYCVIAPLISIWAIITFYLLWLAHGYSILYVNSFEADTGGVLYPRAINQTFTGLYVMELCVSGMFFGVVDDQGKYTCVVHGFFMIGTLVLTAIYQIVLNSSFSSLFEFMPIDAFEKDSQENASMVTSSREQGQNSTVTYEPPAVRAKKPTVWVPNWCSSGCEIADIKPVTEEGSDMPFEVSRTMCDRKASLDKKGRVVVEVVPREAT